MVGRGVITTMKFSVHVEVRGLPGIADPEGRTIERALPALGFSGVSSVRVGKVIAFDLEAADESAARDAAEQMCARLLSNPVIQRAEVSIASA
jgi:phosphoribosylformylglycinamidine synthase PurS subunit